MNSKMTTNSQLSTTEPKKPQNYANNCNRNRITEMEITWRVISMEVGENGGKGTRNKKQNCSIK